MWYVGVFVVLYAAWCLTLAACQDRLVFPRDLAGRPALDAAPPGVERVWIVGEGDGDGGRAERVEGWFVAGDGRSAASPGPAVIFVHGNAELIDDNLGMAAMYRGWGMSVLLAEYRGYGRSEGRPSERAIVADLVAFHGLLRSRPEVDPARIVLHGRSIGGAAAAQLAARRTPAALIMESTLTSVASFAGRYLVPGFLVKHPFRTDRALPTLACPVLIMHGRDDTIVPPSHGRRLHELAPSSVYVEMDGGHNDFPRDQAEYRRVVRGFLEREGLIAAGERTGGVP